MKLNLQKTEVTFDDILILPNKSNFSIENEKEKISLKTQLTRKLDIDVPIISSPMPGVSEVDMCVALGKVGGIGFLHHFQSHERQLFQVKKIKENNVKIAVCVDDFSERGIAHIKNLLSYGVDLISIETGHAYNTEIVSFIKKIRTNFPDIQLSVALVVTGQATKELIEAGADSIRVGIGGGSHCTTRLVTGIGRPQLSAIEECYKIAKKYDVPIISDTGIKFSGDIAKALIFGASSVMIGGLFTGTDEAPGKIIRSKGKKYKMSWGMNTHTAMTEQQVYMANGSNIFKDILMLMKKMVSATTTEKLLFEEGVEGLIPYKGSVEPILTQLIDGLYRSMWYLGAKNISELRRKATVVVVSPSTHLENIPRI